MKTDEIYTANLTHITKKDLKKAGYKTIEEAMMEYNDYIIDHDGETAITFEDFLKGEREEGEEG